MVHIHLIFMSELREPLRLALQEIEIDERSCLYAVEIARCLTCFLSSTVTTKDLQFGT
jgi:hypothetical protein